MVLLKKSTLFAIIFALAANTTAQAAVINKRHGHQQQQQSDDCACDDNTGKGGSGGVAVGGGAGAGASVAGGAGASIGAGAGAAVGAGAGAAVGGAIGGSVGAGAGLAVGGSAGASAGASVGASAGASAGAGAGLAIGGAASAAAGGHVGLGLGAHAGVGIIGGLLGGVAGGIGAGLHGVSATVHGLANLAGSLGVSVRGSGKAGLCLDGSIDAHTDFSFLSGGHVSWLHDRKCTRPDTIPHGVKYVPTLWDAGAEAAFCAASTSFGAWGVDSLLSFNLPDLEVSAGGCGMSAVDAALVHKRVFTDELHSKFKIGCPSVSSSKQWLVDFNAACDGGCNYDFIPMAVHHTKAEAAISLIADFHATFGKNIWVTECSCKDDNGNECSAADADIFMKEMIKFAHKTSYVERWSWSGSFQASASVGTGNDCVQSNNKLTALGSLFVHLG